MANRANAGGGLGSNKVVHSSNPKVEPKPRAVSPAAVSQIGQNLGNHSTDSQAYRTGAEPLYAGPGYSTPVGPTKSVPGPGGGREVRSTGSQGQHGPVAGMAPEPARGILGPKGGRQP
jgi:hypothetical protein